MTGVAIAHFLVSGIRRLATGIAGDARFDPIESREDRFNAPKTAAAEGNPLGRDSGCGILWLILHNFFSGRAEGSDGERERKRAKSNEFHAKKVCSVAGGAIRQLLIHPGRAGAGS